MTDRMKSDSMQAGERKAGGPFRAMYLQGTNRTGHSGDAGKLYHAVSAENSSFGKALCGRKPGKHSGGWGEYGTPSVTCPRCIAALSKPTQVQG